MIVELTEWILEMTDSGDLTPGRALPAGIEVRQAEVPSVELSRFLYTAVGGDWYWTGRLGWTYGEWQAWVDRPEHETWIAYDRGTPAGYAALVHHINADDDQVEIANFGLLAPFIGRGIGAGLLTAAVQRAWALGPRRVWLSTCSLDGPNALPNYLARGFRIYAIEHGTKDVPERPVGPWPGAR
jgi:GNAT superfamily N-acetyltransferase